MSKQSDFKQFNLAQVHSLVLFDPQIRPYLGQSGLGSNGNEEVLSIPQSSRITGSAISDCLVSYQDTL